MDMPIFPYLAIIEDRIQKGGILPALLVKYEGWF
jgi:hypothetical protein